MKSKCGAALLLTLVLVLACAVALAEEFKVSFDTTLPAGATVTVTGSPAEQIIAKNNTVVEPAAPSADGYEFKGWYTDNTNWTTEYVFTDPVTKDFTLYAKWERIQHTVTFDLQGGSFDPPVPTTVTVNHGDEVTALSTNPTKEGSKYAFGGWYKEPTCATKFKFTGEAGADKVTSNITLYAKWSINQYEVNFDKQGHGVQPPTQTVNHGEKAKNPGDLVEQGYRFDGWFTDLTDTNPYDFNTQVTAPVTLHAKWTKMHTVTFNMNGHGAVIKPVPVADGGKVTAPYPVPTAEGYTFGGWYTDAGCTTGNEVDFSTAISTDTTFFAKWTAHVDVQFKWQTAITNTTGATPVDPAQVQLMIDGREANTTDTNGTDPVQTLAPETTAKTLWSDLDAGHTYSVTAKDVQGNYTAVCTQTGENTFLITYVENEKLSVATITNKHEVDKIDMVISKYWDDNDNRHRPESIQVQLMQVKNGTTVAVTDNNGNPIVLTLNNSNHWTAHVPNLFMRENGTTIQYIIEEVGEVRGYKATCEIVVDAQGNYTVRVTNVLTGKLDLEGWKKWDDDNDRDGIRPQSVQLKIYENSISPATLVKNVIVDARTVDSNNSNMWKWTVEDLPVYDAFGRAITYIVVEDPVPAGYTATAPAYITVGTTP